MTQYVSSISFFFFNDTATTEIYTLSLHDALPISPPCGSSASDRWVAAPGRSRCAGRCPASAATARSASPRPKPGSGRRSEEHTSELQSRQYLVCRLLLEKKTKYVTLLLVFAQAVS